MRAKGFWGGTLILGIIALGFGAQTALASTLAWLNPVSSGVLILLLIAGLSFVFRAPLGRLLSYLFNSPEMHIWHHAKHLPKDRPMGVNFGLTLAIWDYLFGTHYIPYEGRDEELGFEGDEKFPVGFAGQQLHGLAPKVAAPKPQKI
jgi:sterol desaturase/sphingolipid hydroxylase (fatty acid hydroxylase superfamily)